MNNIYHGHMHNPEWYDKQNPYSKYYYKVTSTFFKIEEAKAKSFVADPMSYVGSKPDIEIRYKV